MLSPELKAQAQLAWHNWKAQLAGQFPTLSEEEYVNLVAHLQGQHNAGLVHRDDYNRRMAELLKNPSAAVQVNHHTPPQRSTDSLLKELESLHKAKILNDEEYEERKAELMFQRNVNAPEELFAPPANPEERRKRLFSYLDTLLQEKVLSQTEYEAARARV